MIVFLLKHSLVTNFKRIARLVFLTSPWRSFEIFQTFHNHVGDFSIDRAILILEERFSFSCSFPKEWAEQWDTCWISEGWSRTARFAKTDRKMMFPLKTRVTDKCFLSCLIHILGDNAFEYDFTNYTNASVVLFILNENLRREKDEKKDANMMFLIRN